MNQAHNTKSDQSGFTIIELTLSMAFIAMLLLGIAMLTIQISSIYNKGLTLRSVNESGQLIASDIQRTLNVSRAVDVIRVGDATGGRLCANNSIYAWNYAGRLADGFNRFDTGQEVRMVRVVGDNTFCQAQPSGPTYKDLPYVAETTTELLKAGDNTLAMHDLTFSQTDVKDDDTQRMYAISFIVGTSDTAIMAANGCENPESQVDDEYCAVNQFSFTARAGNRGI